MKNLAKDGTLAKKWMFYPITFFIINLMLNIFMLNNFFLKSVFFEETEKIYSGGTQLKYEGMMTMRFNWRLWHQNWVTLKISRRRHEKTSYASNFALSFYCMNGSLEGRCTNYKNSGVCNFDFIARSVLLEFF